MPRSVTPLNHNAFSEYSAESAYWAGFLAADGNLRISHSNCRCIRVYLSIVDKVHLEKFKRFLGSGHKIATPVKYPRCSLEFVSEKIYDDLVSKYNLTPRKSMTYQFPTQVPDEYLPHFMRGYFDGDGCLCETFQNKNSTTASYTVTMVGTDNFVTHCKTVVEPHLSREIKYKASTHTNGETKIFNLSTRQAKEFLDWIYGCSTEETRLDRKYEMYHRICVQNIRKTRKLPPYGQRTIEQIVNRIMARQALERTGNGIVQPLGN